MNERVTTLAGAVEKLAAESIETRERLVRVETVLELAFKTKGGRGLIATDSTLSRGADAEDPM